VSEKILKILSHQGNKNQNYVDILSHYSQNGYHEENKKATNGGKGWEIGSLSSAGANVN
jgi:hypothetical protein